MQQTLFAAVKFVRMSSRKRSAAASTTARTKRIRTIKEDSPTLAARGLELDIGHAPELVYPSPNPPSTPRSQHINQRPTTPVTPAKVEQLKPGSLSKMSPSKLKILESLGASPFPDFSHPTHDECKRVNAALTKAHGTRIRPKEFRTDSLGANCGEVPSVLDALVRTILSQNTNNKNSSTAKLSLDKAFGLGNYQAVRNAPLEDVVEALRCGGLANIKAARIKRLLDEVYNEYGKLSLDHLHAASDEEAKRQLMQFDGVGPKTASCVLLFCLRRDSFAVDTHVFRITKALGWVPAKANREQTFAHLDARVPEDLKYSLHTLIITHGRKCSNCAARGMPGNKKVDDLEGGCPLKGMLKAKPSSIEE